jgi:F-type H+-transporting ATPase subunit delta
MSNPRLAGRYAKSLLEIGLERNNLEKLYQDVLFMKKLCDENKDFVNLLKSPIVKPDKKKAIIDKILQGRVDIIMGKFSNLLVQKGREDLLPEILNCFIEQYKAHNEIHIARLTTAVPISEEIKNKFITQIRQGSKYDHIELHTEVDEKLVGGFVLEMDGKLINASVLYGLQNVKKQFNKNDFIFRMR